MPTVVDSFMMQMGWDTSAFKKGSDEIEEGVKRTRDAVDSSAKQIEASGKRAANYIASLKNEVVGLFLAFAGGKSLTEFASGIVQNDAAVGRLSRNIGMSTNAIGAWQAAVKEMGGSGDEATGALGVMAKAISDARMGLRPDNAGVLNALGVNQDNMKDPSQMLLRIAEASQRMDPMVFNNLASRLGFSPSMVALLERGNKALEAQLPILEKSANLTQKDAEQAQALQRQLADLSTLIQGKARPYISGLADDLTKVLTNGKAAGPVLDDWGEKLAVIAIIGAAAGAPFIAMAAGLAAIATQWDVAKDKLHSFEAWWNGLVKGTQAPGRGNDMLNHLRGLFGIHAGDPTDAERLFPNLWGKGAGASPGRSGGSSGGGGAATGGNRKQIVDFFKARGFNDAEAQGIWAGIWAESKGNPNAVGPMTASGHQAYGIGQWLSPDRVAAFQRVMHKPLRGSSLPDQLAFMAYEFKHGERPAAMSIAAANSSTGALAAIIQQFYRPGAGAAGDWSRGLKGLGVHPGMAMPRAGSTISFGNIIVNNPSGDPRAAGAAVVKAIRRNLRGVQADGAFN